MTRIGYLGPAGTFSEEAAILYAAGRKIEIVGCPSLEDIFSDVAGGRLDEGVVPVENSTEGAVGAVLDLLAGPYQLCVRGEIFLPVRQTLMAARGLRLEQVERVLSHYQALAQCRGFLRRKLPAALLEECASTAVAAGRVAASAGPWAALGLARAGRKYGLQEIASNANDYPDNVTRFWILGREPLPVKPEQSYKTSIVFGLGDRPGALYTILREFAERGINLTRIESRPAKKNMGEYLFFIDLIGGQEQPVVRQALRQVDSITLGLKILGYYPVKD